MQGIILSIYPALIKYTQIFNSVGLLGFVWHLSSTFWMWFNLVIEESSSDSWIAFLELAKLELPRRYIYCLYFTMNLATTTGYSEGIIYNENERIVFLFLIYLGNALFAVAFGLMAASSKSIPEKYDKVYQMISKLERMFGKEGIPPKTKLRVENFYSNLII